MKPVRKKLFNRFNRVICYLIRKTQKPIWPDHSRGYLTIFFDYEGDYAKPDKMRTEASVYGVKRILEICRKHNIRATFNTVGKLFIDYPEIIKQIIYYGHDITSHSFKHDDISILSRNEIDNDIKLTKQVFDALGLVLRGMRSPQNKWSFKQMAVMLDNGLVWSMERDYADYPYIIYRKGNKKLVRFPILFGDYNFYIAKKYSADQMYDVLVKAATNIQDKKIFGAIGFHPWVIGQDESRFQSLERFFEYLSEMLALKIITFNDAYNLIERQQD